MPTLKIEVRVGAKTKLIHFEEARISVGRTKSARLVLPFDWIRDRHLVIDNTESPRIKLGTPDAEAKLDGATLTTTWAPLPSPARIEIPTHQGQPLRLDISRTDRAVNAGIVRGPVDRSEGAFASEDLGVRVATWAAPGDTSSTGGDWDIEPDGEAALEPLPEPGLFVRSPKLILTAYGGFFAVLVLAALGFNQFRRTAERTRISNDTAFVSDHLRQANELIGQKQYVAAKAALDAAYPVAKSRAALADAVQEINRIREKPEIRMGSLGYVEVDGQWITSESANAWRNARDRDDPKITQLEEDAGRLLNEKKYVEARQACEQAIALMDSQPVKPHPRLGPVKAQLETIKNESLSAEMTAKGLVLHENRWITKEEKVRAEQEAKGLVEYQGRWLTKQEVAAAQAKGDSGMIFHKGKWMTADEKMTADGYVKFEGEWMRAEKHQQLLATRQQEAEKLKLEQAKVEENKRAAYVASQGFVRKQLAPTAKVTFRPYGGDDVRVAYDNGWYIVKGLIDQTDGKPEAGKKVFYCKLKQGNAGEWEVESTFFAN